MLRVVTILRENPFVRQITTLMTGSVIAQAISLLIAPLLTRLYTPTEYGISGVFASVMLLMGSFATLQYVFSISTAGTDREAAIANRASLTVGMVMLTLITAVTAAFAPELTRILGFTEYPIITWCIPVGFAVVVLTQVQHFTATRERRFRALAEGNLWSVAVGVSVQLAGSVAGAIALVAGNALGQTANAVRLLIVTKRRPKEEPVRARDVQAWLSRHWRLPAFTVTQSLAYQIGTSGLPIVIALAFSSEEAGWFMLAYRAVTMPVMLVGQAVGTTFLSRASAAHASGRLGEVMERVGTTVIRFGLPAVGVGMLVLPLVVPMVFGRDWAPAGVMAGIMLPGALTGFLSGVLSNAIFPLKREQVGAVTQGILLVFRAIAVVVGVQTNSLLLTLILYATSSVVMQVGLIAWVERLAGAERWISRELIFGFLAGLVIAAPGLVSVTTNVAIPWGMFASGVLLAGYFGLRFRSLLR